jgi:hypothetical protein
VIIPLENINRFNRSELYSTHRPKYQAQNSTVFRAMSADNCRAESGDCELTVVCLLKKDCVVIGPEWLLRKVIQQ